MNVGAEWLKNFSGQFGTLDQMGKVFAELEKYPIKKKSRRELKERNPLDHPNTYSRSDIERTN